MSQPREPHLLVANKVLQYIKVHQGKGSSFQAIQIGLDNLILGGH